MTETTKEACASCGSHLRGTGPASSVLSKRYCMKRTCQTAKQRAYRAQLRHGSEEAPTEERPCFHCGADLPARASRVTDHPAGRWCPKIACQRDRAARVPVWDEVELVKAEGGVPSFDLQGKVARLARAAGLLERVVCGCGHSEAVRNYRHPAPNGEMCKLLGNFPATRPDIEQHVVIAQQMKEDATE